MALTPDVINRLAVVRYLFDLGARQRHEPVPGCFPALLAFDDAIELFLHGAVLHLKAKIPPNGHVIFDKYFELAKDIGHPLDEQPIALLVHNERNMFKHRGHWPTPGSLADAHERTQRFLHANCKQVFGIEFAAVSVAILIEAEDVREAIDSAHSGLDAGRSDLAMIYTAIGFRLARRTASRAVGGEDLSAKFSRELWQLESGLQPSDLSSSASHAIKRAFEHSHDQIAEVITADRLGLTDARYIAFERLLPDVDADWSGDPSHYYTDYNPAPTLEVARSALQFATETILRMQGRTRA